MRAEKGPRGCVYISGVTVVQIEPHSGTLSWWYWAGRESVVQNCSVFKFGLLMKLKDFEAVVERSLRSAADRVARVHFGKYSSGRCGLAVIPEKVQF